MILALAGFLSVVYTIIVVVLCFFMLGGAAMLLVSGVIGLIANAARRGVVHDPLATGIPPLRCDRFGALVGDEPPKLYTRSCVKCGTEFTTSYVWMPRCRPCGAELLAQDSPIHLARDGPNQSTARTN